MSVDMEEEVKRWTARRKSALVLEIIQGRATVAEAARSYDLPPSEIEDPRRQAICRLKFSILDDGDRGQC